MEILKYISVYRQSIIAFVIFHSYFCDVNSKGYIRFYIKINYSRSGKNVINYVDIIESDNSKIG